MKLSLRDAAATMVERVSEFDAAATAYNAATFGSHAEYSRARERYVSTRRLLVPASRDLKDALGSDSVRIAAEAGSPQARMLEPVRKDGRLSSELNP